MQSIPSYLKQSRDELRKVEWPSRQTTTQHTLLVIGISLAMAAFLGGIDYVFTKVLAVVL
ncbi:MAG: hypothetical protein G01um101431_80 [Parcubacteria group bacterium Gr01-1014_31]|nr:MAG: hypothetical protein G01um101431_80 [Parcubacteria group bacterium Gr01-1014_31]